MMSGTARPASRSFLKATLIIPSTGWFWISLRNIGLVIHGWADSSKALSATRFATFQWIARDHIHFLAQPQPPCRGWWHFGDERAGWRGELHAERGVWRRTWLVALCISWKRARSGTWLALSPSWSVA